MKRIKLGDVVVVTTGKCKGYVGKVAKMLRDRVIVEGANLIKKHVKPNPHKEERGGIVSLESSLHISNVALYNPDSKKGEKVGFKYVEEGDKKQKVRYFKSTGEIVDKLGDTNNG